MSEAFRKYKDGRLEISVPDYLKPDKVGRLFRADRRRNKTPLIEMLAVTFLNKGMYEAILKSMKDSANLPRGSSPPEVADDVVFYRPIKLLNGGYEMMTTFSSSINGNAESTYMVAIEGGSEFVSLSFIGKLDDLFYSSCSSVLHSLKLLDGRQTTV